MVNNALTITALAWASPQRHAGGPLVAVQGTFSKASPNIADWLPLLGSIIRALSDMAEDDCPTIQATAPQGAVENPPEAAAR